jgi:hypothetical protein
MLRKNRRNKRDKNYSNNCIQYKLDNNKVVDYSFYKFIIKEPNRRKNKILVYKDQKVFSFNRLISKIIKIKQLIF